jgi:hypothetical protein
VTRPDLGRGYFPVDKQRHLADAPKHCPSCGGDLVRQGIAVEFWEQDRRIFACYCSGCAWTGDIVLTERVVGHEPEH